MYQETRTLVPQRIVYVELPFGDGSPNSGPHQAWTALQRYSDENKLGNRTTYGMGAVMDDFATTPADQVRYRACYFIPDAAPLPPRGDTGAQEGLSEAGRYAVFLYTGPWEGLGPAWDRVMAEALPATGLTQRTAPLLEIYLDDAATTPADQLRTEFFVPVE